MWVLNFFKNLANRFEQHEIYDPFCSEEYFIAKDVKPLLTDQLPSLQSKLHFARTMLQEAVEQREKWSKSVEERLNLVEQIEQQISIITEFIDRQ